MRAQFAPRAMDATGILSFKNGQFQTNTGRRTAEKIPLRQYNADRMHLNVAYIVPPAKRRQGGGGPAVIAVLWPDFCKILADCCYLAPFVLSRHFRIRCRIQEFPGVPATETGILERSGIILKRAT